uniref:MYG1 protein, related n=1 Tax=Asparagus officinalis TaxID=4686 RepID=Q2AA96_ASPOF|nr:MYG1 protein, related [Asparagus officinalis]
MNKKACKFLVKLAIDAIDNGVNQYDTDQPPRYVSKTNLSSRVGRLNLDWMDPDQSSEKENAAFHKAMALAGTEFLESVRYYAKSWLPARSIVMECLASRGDIDPSGEIMALNKDCPEIVVHDCSLEIHSRNNVVPAGSM